MATVLGGLACHCSSSTHANAPGGAPAGTVDAAGIPGGGAGAAGGSIAGNAGGSSGGQGGSASDRRICDGSTGIRLAVRTLVDSTRVRAYTSLLYELGFDFLYVDGTCHYWVQEPSVPPDDYMVWRAYREGTLTDAQELQLHDAVSYDDVEAGVGCIGALPEDGSPVSVWDGSQMHVCGGQVQGETDWPMRTNLFDAGSTMTGPVRIEVGQDYVLDTAKRYPWPLDMPPESFEIDYSSAQQYGQSSLITDASAADAVRALRDEVLADAQKSPGDFYGIIFVDPKGYVMAMRDDLPFTRSSDGLWQP